MKKEKFIKYVSIVLRIVIAIVFLLAGSGKFQTDSTMASNFINWNLGISIMFIVGVFEVLGVVFLFIPKTVRYGCYMLIFVMLGAMIIHILNFEELGFPILNGALIIALILIIFFKKLISQKVFNNHSKL